MHISLFQCDRKTLRDRFDVLLGETMETALIPVSSLVIVKQFAPNGLLRDLKKEQSNWL